MSTPCKWYARGRCSYGDNCKFSHDAAPQPPRRTTQGPEASTSRNPLTQERQTSTDAEASTSTSKPRMRRGEKACKAWRVGDCAKGDKCFFAHDPQVREERLRRERAEAERRQREEQRQAELARREAARQAEVARQEAARQEAERRAEAARQAQHAQTVRHEAARTVQRIVLGTSLVTYAAGITIRNVVTGFESCYIRIKGLPTDARPEEILALFTQQGVDRNSLFLVGTKPVDGRVEATVITTAEEGGAIAIGLEGIEFRHERLDFEICENANGMGVSSSKDSDTLTLTWRAPCSTVVATFASDADARSKVQSLNRQVCGGRRVKVEINQPQPNRVHLDGNRSIKISGLPLVISPELVAEFAGCGVSELHFLKPIAYDAAGGLRQLEQHIRLISPRDLLSFAASLPPEGDMDGNVTAKARFTSWEAAKRVEEFLAGRKLAFLGNRFPWTRLPDPHQYILSIPPQQYRAQKRIWDSFAEPGPGTASVRVHVPPYNNARVQIRVVGDDKQAVGSLKVRVENVAGGEALPRDLWHRSLKLHAGSQFINSVFDATGVYARADWKLCVVKLYGAEPAAIERARDMVRAEVERLNALEWSVFLKRESIRFFVQRGVKTLKETFGEENAALVFTGGTTKLVIRGGEDARQVVDRLIAESIEGGPPRTTTGTSCPICYDEVTHPVLLGCNHSYCMGCLRHYISTAADTFPLHCLGNEATCGVPIALPVIERFLSPAQFQELLETAYTRYIEQHPDEFKYCKTADCTQVYRRQPARAGGPTPTPVTCPSCFFKVCPACDEEGHEGMSCEQRRLQNDPGEQERRNEAWAAEHGVKRCPVCSVYIEKTEGCNHMTCRCGAHICWICVRQFAQGEIYPHLQAVHGGAFDVPAELRAAAPPPPYGLRLGMGDLDEDAPARAQRLERARRAREAMVQLPQPPAVPAVQPRARIVPAAAAQPARPLPPYQGDNAWLQEYQARRAAERRELQERWRRQAEADAQRQRVQREAAAAAARQRENGGWCIVM